MLKIFNNSQSEVLSGVCLCVDVKSFSHVTGMCKNSVPGSVGMKEKCNQLFLTGSRTYGRKKSLIGS